MDKQDRQRQQNQEDMEEDIESVSHMSFRSVTRSESEGSYSARLSPRATDPEEEDEDIDIESQCFVDAKEETSTFTLGRPFLFDFQDCAPWNTPTSNREADKEAPTSPVKNKEQDTNPSSPDHPGTSRSARDPRWWEARGEGSAARGWWEQAAGWSENSGRSRHSIFSFATPPPPQLPQRSGDRRFGRPGAFNIPGINARLNRDGEEEKQEETSHYSGADGSDSLVDEMEDILLLEATLVSEKSSTKGSDSELPTCELFHAEPLISRWRPRHICAMVVLLSFIAVVAAAAGTEWGRRQYDFVVPSATSTASPASASALGPEKDASLNNGPATSSSSSTPPMRLPGSTSQEGNIQTWEPVLGAPPHSQINSSSILSISVSNASSSNVHQSASDYVLSLLPEKTKLSLDDPISPQSMAFKWLMDDPTLEKYSAGRILQRYALACIFFSADGPNWERKDHYWLSYDQDECSWWSDVPSGLLCQDGYYQILSLNSQLSLNGTLPDEIWLLSSLVSLQLFEHDLSGTLPTRIAKMPRLESLLLHDLSLEGSIPSEIGLAKLKSLSLGGNMLQGTIPAEIGESESLHYLYLHNNLLNGSTPASMFALTELEELVLNNNSLTGTIDWIGGLTALKLAYLAFNSFSGTLPDFNSLTDLQALVLQANDFTGVIPDLSGLEHLEFIFLGLNQLTGTLTTELFSLSSLMVLDLGQNSLHQSIPSEIGDLAALEVLDLFDNSFSGTIPTQLGLLSSATKIMLENNMLEGTIPTQLGLLTGLERLWLHDNNLSGSVPIEICDLIEMNGLDVAVDCFKVSCDCGCNCEKSTPPEPTMIGDRNEDEGTSTSAWEDFVAWWDQLFNGDA